MRHAILATTLLLAGCAVQPPASPPQPYVPAGIVNPPPPRQIDIPPDPVTALDPAVRDAFLNDRPSVRDGITTYYAYRPHENYEVSCAPLKITNINLAADESIIKNGVNLGDSARWLVDASERTVVIKANPTAGVAVNGNAPVPATNFSTNLIIETNRRIYHFILRSGARAWNEEIAFFYPDDYREAQLARQDALRRAAKQAIDPAAKQLNFAYRIEGPPVPWKPVLAFDDTEHFYVQLPSDLMGSDAPVLMSQNGNQPEAVNYQVKNSYIVADHLLSSAVLTSGTGANRTVVRITRQ